MIAVDSNILVYAHREDSPWHAQAFACLASLAQGRAAWAIPWPCVHEFLAIVTHPGIYNPPTPLQAALAQVEAWLEAPGLVLLAETGSYWPDSAGHWQQAVLRVRRCMTRGWRHCADSMGQWNCGPQTGTLAASPL